MLHPIQPPSKSATSQRGIASIVFVVLVSLALTSTSVGLIHTFRSAQQITIASNAITHAKNGMWLGVEAFRLYIEGLSQDELDDLPGIEHNISFESGDYGHIVASEITLQSNAPTNTTHVIVTIKNIHDAARTSTSIRVVYDYQPEVPASTGTTSLSSDPLSISFDGALDMTGGITLVQNTDEKVSINVDGAVNLGGVSITPLHQINTTGIVNLDSNVEVDTIHANGNIHLSGSASVELAKTLGTFTIEGGGYAKQVFANDDVNIHASKRSDELNSQADILITQGGHGTSLAGGEITIKSGPHDSLKAVSNITMKNVWAKVDSSVSAEGNITCTSRWWSDFSTILANGTLINCPTVNDPKIAMGGVENLSFESELEDAEVEPYEHNETLVDVWTQQELTNYFIEYNDAAKNIQITVNGIKEVVDGSVYYVGNYNNYEGTTYKDYLCNSVNAAGNCTSPSVPLFPICIGSSINNECLSYNKGTNTFTLNPSYTAPGVMLFDGNLLLNNGHSMSTILAAGNIRTAGEFKAWAPNYGGYEKICQGDGSHMSNDIKARYEEAFSKYYPEMFCNKTAGTYQSSAIGNLSMAAGGYSPYSPDTYVGGTIDLGANTNIVGAVLAGDVLKTSGDVTIKGIIGAGSDGTSTDSNSISGSTTVDFVADVSKPDYQPFELPNLSEYEVAGQPQTASLLWARNL